MLIVSSNGAGFDPVDVEVREAIVFRDPKGTLIEIFATLHFHARDKSDLGIGTLKLGHVAYRVQDVQKIVSFYNDVLGFRTSDWIGDHFAFLHVEWIITR